MPFARNVFPNLRYVYRFRGFAEAKFGAGAYVVAASTITRSIVTQREPREQLDTSRCFDRRN